MTLMEKHFIEKGSPRCVIPGLLFLALVEGCFPYVMAAEIDTGPQAGNILNFPGYPPENCRSIVAADPGGLHRKGAQQGLSILLQ